MQVRVPRQSFGYTLRCLRDEVCLACPLPRMRVLVGDSQLGGTRGVHAMAWRGGDTGPGRGCSFTCDVHPRGGGETLALARRAALNCWWLSDPAGKAEFDFETGFGWRHLWANGQDAAVIAVLRTVLLVFGVPFLVVGGWKVRRLGTCPGNVVAANDVDVR